MKTGKLLAWLIPLVLLLLLIPFLVPAAVPGAEAEEVQRVYSLDELPVYQPVTLENPSPDPIPLEGKNLYGPRADAFLPDDGGYVDSTLSVRVEERTLGKTKVLFTWIQIADPTQLRTATFRPYPSAQEAYATSIAEREKSVLAISGDFFVGKEKGGRGVVWRNGKLLRKRDCGVYDSLVIDRAGDFHIIRHATVEQVGAFGDDIMHSFVFGPGLVIDGELTRFNLKDEQDDWIFRHIGGQKLAQRNVLCQMGPLSYLVITSEGPEQVKGAGFTIPEIAQLACDMGALQAYNLDGGSSTWLVLGTERIQNKGRPNKRRTIADIVYFATAEPNP